MLPGQMSHWKVHTDPEQRIVFFVCHRECEVILYVRNRSVVSEDGDVTSGIGSEVGDITVDTTGVGVGDPRAETATDDNKFEVDNVTPGIVGNIPACSWLGSPS